MSFEGSPDVIDELDDATVSALHEVELGYEWLQRANGHLLQFHHATGHGMDHLAVAEEHLRAAGHDDLANEVRDRLLPMGVDGDRWSYDLVETFQGELLADARSFEERARQDLADGHRHVMERQQERRWKDRCRE